MSIVFIGASKFGLRCLDSLNKLNSIKVSGVVTAPESFSISYSEERVKNVLHADINGYCQYHNIPCTMLRDKMNCPDLINQVRAWQPKMFVVVGWYHMLTKPWMEIAPAYGMHASLLPDYTGGAPLVWAMINGETKTGITLFRFADGVDNGPVVDAQQTVIDESDTIASLYQRIERLGVELLEAKIPDILDGSAKHTPQNESLRRTFPQRTPKDGHIDWQKSSVSLYNFIRAQTRPYPGAFSRIAGRKLKIWAVAKVKDKVLADRIRPGECVIQDGKLYVGTLDGKLEILEATLEGEEYSQNENSEKVLKMLSHLNCRKLD